MKTIGQLLKKKGGNVWTVGANESVYVALQNMAEKNIGALVVMDGDQPAGIVSERDYARKCILKGLSSDETPVSAIMVSRVICVSPKESVEEALALMTDKHIRHLPVLENEKLVGIVSIGDLVSALIEEQQILIDQLISYING